MKKRFIIIPILMIAVAAMAFAAYHYNLIPHKGYTNSDFNIEPYTSAVDMDNDGIDDQTDILENAKAYVAKKPPYESRYYDGGYPTDGYGVCTDVVAFAMLDAGYDLMMLVNEDIAAHLEDYDIEQPDENIDFRRVKNLMVYFNNNAISLTTDTSAVEQWQGGDIVVFKNHVGIVSDKRNKNGVPFLIHHAYNGQVEYEQDVMDRYGEITGHFRIS